jgi:hypothetical protein
MVCILSHTSYCSLSSDVCECYFWFVHETEQNEVDCVQVFEFLLAIHKTFICDDLWYE